MQENLKKNINFSEVPSFSFDNYIECNVITLLQFYLIYIVGL